MEKKPLKISIMVPAYNEEKVIGTLLSQLTGEVDYPDFEVLVGIDNGDDKTLEIARGFAKKDKRIVIDYDPIRRGCTQKINALLKIARGEIAIKLDADILLGNPKKELHWIAKYFQDTEVGGIYYTGERDFEGTSLKFMAPKYAAMVKREAEKSFVARGESFVNILVTLYRLQFFPVKGKPKIPIDIHCFRRKLVPMLDPSVVHDDVEFANIVLSKGYKIVFAPDAVNVGPGGYPFDSGALFNQKLKGNVGWHQMSKRYGLNYYGYCASLLLHFFKGFFKYKYKPIDLLAFFYWGIVYIVSFVAAIPKRNSSATKVWKRFERKMGA